MTITFEQIIEKCQKYLENQPTIIVGSGASVPYGLPTMHELSRELLDKLNDKYHDDDEWNTFVASLENTGNLESALHEAKLKTEIIKAIIITTWKFIDSRDKEVFIKVYNRNSVIQLSRIFDKLLQSHPRTINVITANYDRLVEYSADTIHADVNLGFGGTYIKHFKGMSSQVCSRTINLCKVHGSLDWFRRTMDNQLISITGNIYDENKFFPVIVTPGIQKYQETHMEPYRTLINVSDSYINSANSFLCIGYGFNDEHLQPKLIDRIQVFNKPIVIVTHTLSTKGKEILEKSKKYIAFESYEDSKTRITTDGGEIIIDGSYWELEKFIDCWIG